ncbi:MAG: response regulator [Saprospiraceae bacterium]
MRNIRTLVVDDEPLARARIVNLLNKAENISVLGECKNGREAMKSIATYKPDLVFLDIQMPDLNGFDVLNSGKLNDVPFIIFVTAFDQYALQAFDVKAVDYLLKPYDDERFFKALEHARTQIAMKDSALLHQKMVNLLEEQKVQNGEINDVIELKER